MSAAVEIKQLFINDGLLTQRFFNDILKNCRKIVGHFSHSPTASARFAELQQQLGVPVKKLIQDIQTRWNSTFYMLQRIFEQKAVLVQYAADHDIPHFTAQNWSMIEKVIDLLQPCEQLTREMSSDDSSTSMVIPAYNVLRRTLMAADDKGIKTIKESLLEALDTRFVPYTLDTKYVTATILDPRFKSSFIGDGMLSDAKLTINSRIVDTQVTQSDDDEVVPAKKSMWDFLEEKTESASSSRNTDQNELEQYLGEAKLPRSADPLEY